MALINRKDRQRKRIGLDMDGILTDLNGFVFRACNKALGTNLTVADMLDFNYEKCVPEVFRPNVVEMMSTVRTFEEVPPLPGAQKAVEELTNYFDIYIVSSPPRKCLKAAGAKMEWMVHHFPMVNQRNIFIGDAKYAVHVDLFLDDNKPQLAKYREEWPDAILCTIDYPHNQTAEVHCRANDGLATESAWTHLVGFMKFMGGVY